MVVDDLDVLRTGVGPDEADPPLVVDADAVLPRSVTTQPFQPVAWKRPQVIERLGGIQPSESLERGSLNVGTQTADALAIPQTLRILVAERADHPWQCNARRYNCPAAVRMLAVNPCQVKGAGVEHHDERPTATLVAMATHLVAVPNRIRPGGHGEQGR